MTVLALIKANLEDLLNLQLTLGSILYIMLILTMSTLVLNLTVSDIIY